MIVMFLYKLIVLFLVESTDQVSPDNTACTMLYEIKRKKNLWKILRKENCLWERGIIFTLFDNDKCLSLVFIR